MSTEIGSRATRDNSLAKSILGKVLLVGITYKFDQGELTEQQQFFGEVVSSHHTDGALLELMGQRDGEQYNLPPDTSAINPAAPGIYRLRATGEEVADPDLTVMYTIHRPAAAKG